LAAFLSAFPPKDEARGRRANGRGQTKFGDFQ
jgi:hypothetical protein